MFCSKSIPGVTTLAKQTRKKKKSGLLLKSWLVFVKMHKSTLSNIADDSKWGGLVVLPVRETWATSSFMWIDKGKCTVLHLAGTTPGTSIRKWKAALQKWTLRY